MAVNVSGTAPPLQSGGSDSGGGGQGGRDAEAAAPAANIQSIPGRLDVLKWPLIAGFVGIFALGAMLLARKPVVAVAGGVPVANVAIAPAPSAPLSQVDAAVGTSLDALKDQMFRLELRRQAGTISEEEYTRERARAEKVLRDLVRG
jgi:hypothetical protein